MIHTGDTIVYHAEHGLMFYWLCEIRTDGYLFFNWFGDPFMASISDFWRMSKKWFESKVKEGTIEIFDSFPKDKYGDIFEQQAIERKN